MSDNFQTNPPVIGWVFRLRQIIHFKATLFARKREPLESCVAQSTLIMR